MAVTGAKDSVYQRIISWIPPHDVFIEPFAGSAAVTRHKRLAARTILIDLDPGALDQIGEAARWPGVETIVGDGVEYLSRCGQWVLGWWASSLPRVLIYCDPPYLRETRRNGERRYYAHDWSRADHEHFLDVIVGLSGSAWLVSGYDSKLYRDRLGPPVDRFPAQTRGGPAEECLWANFDRPAELHDYRYIGTDFDERWRIHKRQRNWAAALRRMPTLERRAMLAHLRGEFAAELLTPTDLTGRRSSPTI